MIVCLALLTLINDRHISSLLPVPPPRDVELVLLGTCEHVKRQVHLFYYRVLTEALKQAYCNLICVGMLQTEGAVIVTYEVVRSMLQWDCKCQGAESAKLVE